MYLSQLNNFFLLNLDLNSLVDESPGDDCIARLLVQFVLKLMSSPAGNAGDAPCVLIYKNKLLVGGEDAGPPSRLIVDFRPDCSPVPVGFWAHVRPSHTRAQAHIPHSSHPPITMLPPGGEASLTATQSSSRRSLLARTALF